MAFSSWRTWSTGEVVTAAHMNQEIRDNGDALFPNENAAVSWTPNIEGTSSSGGIVGSGRRWRVGPLQFVWVRFLWIVTTLPNGTFFVELPVAASGIGGSTSSGSGTTVGSWQGRDDSNVGVNEGGTVVLRESDKVHFQRPVGGVLTNSNPWGWTDGDVLTFHAVYPVA